MRRIQISPQHSTLLGVCGSIGATYDIDPNLVRLIVVYMAITSVILPAVVVYLLAWAIFPKQI